MKAYVMINVQPGSENDALQRLEKLEAVEEAYISYGVYDLIIKVKAETIEDLKGAVLSKIRTADEVKSTLTLIIQE